MASDAGDYNNTHHNRDLTLQKYLLLQEQHESLRAHLDELRRPLHPAGLQVTTSFPIAPPTANIMMNASPIGSPTRASSISSSVFSSGQTSPYHSHSRSNSLSRGRRSSLPLPGPPRVSPASGQFPMCATVLETVLDESTLSEVATEEARLSAVNEGIKRALTELLNCEATRGDQAFRTWVQCRLMDTERELRSGRRRRSAPEP